MREVARRSIAPHLLPHSAMDAIGPHDDVTTEDLAILCCNPGRGFHDVDRNGSLGGENSFFVL